jgi:TPP-dependent 2-oxoacid decarboxylase
VSEQTPVALGTYLGRRLVEAGVGHWFGVPGDYNLALLDRLLAIPELTFVGCCNELNAGYAADGYARMRGAGAVVVTFSVGGLSVLNAVAGAYAENLPVVVVSGGPNTNDGPAHHVLHHTLGHVDTGYQRDIFAHVTVAAEIVRRAEDAPVQIDRAIAVALLHRKPVYLEIPCNLAGAPVPAPEPRGFPRTPAGDPAAVAAAADAVAAVLHGAVRPVFVAGEGLRPADAAAAFRRAAEAAGCAVATMPDAKGFFPETHPAAMGVYWGPVSSPGCAEVVESADVVLLAGARLTDYTTAGWVALLEPARCIRLERDTVAVGARLFQDAPMAAVLDAVATRVRPNPASLTAYRRIADGRPADVDVDPDQPLATRRLFARVQALLDARTTVVAETGDSWFNGMKLRLPEGAGFEIQMQYGSIGWSVGATLGCALGAPDRRIVTLVGDGSFQLTAQELSTIVRSGARPLILLLNNGGYTIEVEIHDGPYNVIQPWDYAGLMAVVGGPAQPGRAWRVRTEGELDRALAEALAHDGPCLVECLLDRDDCSRELLEWGRRVATANARPPRAD